MPTMPPVHRPAGARSKAERDKEHDARRRAAQPWRAWYSLPVWRAIRARQLTAEPCCRRCGGRGRTVEATVVHHEEPHRGEWEKFIGGPFESLCKTCHDKDAQSEERNAHSDAL